MEVDERLRWLESRVNSSLHPRGEKLRNLFSDSESRLMFLDFCNNSEKRHLFVHFPSEDTDSLTVSPNPPVSLSTKTLFFLKNSHTSKLHKETISEQVVCTECPQDPIEHLELVVREVYLPMLAEQKDIGQGVSSERVLDILHRMISTIQVTQGQFTGDLVLPMPSLDVLIESAMSGGNDRRAVIVHIMESCVVSWMKQVKMAMHFDPNGTIVRTDGRMAGPMAEVKYWEYRHEQLILVRNQLNSVQVLRILSGLEHARSTYADAFIDVHRDMGKAIVDTESVLMYINTLKPWFQKLQAAFSPDTLTSLFPSLVMTLSLVWQYSGLYSQTQHFNRLLRLISNELARKAADIVGLDPLDQPITASFNIRLALRVCSAFRGYYLDRKDVADKILEDHKEQLKQLQQETTLHSNNGSLFDNSSTLPNSTISLSKPQLCSWPPRNAPVFTSLNSTLERCNDLLELVQTMEHFSELAGVAALDSSDGQDPVLTDVYNHFQMALDKFKSSTQDLMGLEQTGFEESFFEFRSSIKELEAQLAMVLLSYFEESLSLESSLRTLESFQGLISRDSTQSTLRPKLDMIIDTIQSDVNMIRNSLVSFVSTPPIIPNTPPTSSKLLWLQALRRRVDIPIDRVRDAAPYLLQGEKGFTLRHSHNDVLKSIENHWNKVVSTWTKSFPHSIETGLKETLLKQNDSGELQVNFSLILEEVLREIHYLTGPLLSITLPSSLKSINISLSPHVLHQYRVSCQVCIRQYNVLQSSLDPIHRALFHHKLSLLDQLLQEGLCQWNWLSLQVPDFLAKLKTSLQGDLLPLVQSVLSHTESIRNITNSWSQLIGLDIFSDTLNNNLDQLTDMYSQLMESAKVLLSSSINQIEAIFKEAFQCVEVSWDSPSWTDYMNYIDNMIIDGLKQMILYSMNTLTSRAQKYEQGGSIPPMIVVALELHEKEIEFSPPLSSNFSLSSVPERIKKFLEGFVSLSQIPQRIIQSDESYYAVISTDGEVQGNVQKIIAHVETSARQCQSLRKRFSQYSFLWEQDVLATFNEFINGIGLPHPRRFTRPETVGRSRSASHSARSRSHSAAAPVSSQTTSSVLESVTGISDWEFLKPDKDEHTFTNTTTNTASITDSANNKEGKKPKNTTLEDFDGEIAVFQGIQERLTNSLNTVDVGWVCVNQCPIKDTLISLTKKWTCVYANYLEKKVLFVLNELETFFTEVEPQVEAISGEEIDPNHIMTLVTIFNKVNLQQLVMDGKFGAVHRAVAILDKFHHPLASKAKVNFEGVPHRWSSLKKRLALSKQRIAPLIQTHSATIIGDLMKFGLKATQEHEAFLNSPCLLRNCEPDLAQELIIEYIQKLLGLRAQATDLMELQELLQSAVVNFSILNQFEDELNNATLIWERKLLITEYQTAIKSLAWLDVDIEDMNYSCQDHFNSLESLSECSSQWDVRRHIQNAVQEMQLTIPLLEGLSSSHMRPRHWKQVLRYSTNHSLLAILLRNGSLELNVLKQLTVGKFMELNLTNHNTSILAIVDRASKEVAIEELLKNLEEVWLSMQFYLKPHFRLHGYEQIALYENISCMNISRIMTISDIGIEAGRMSSLSPSSPIVRRKSAAASGRVSVISATPNITDYSHTSHGDIMLLDNVEKIFEALDHYQTSLQSLEGSIAASSFTDELLHWHKQLQTVEAVLRVWLQVQSLWVQLEEVLTSTEVAQHLPTAHFNFTSMNKEWKQLLRATAKAPNVIQSCLQEDLLQTLDGFLLILTQCQSALLQYVQGKRAKCPWLYLLPLEDVLQLVCYSSIITVLDRVFPKIIPHSIGLIFNDYMSSIEGRNRPTLTVTPSITGMNGIKNDKLYLTEAVDCDGPVEGILNNLLVTISDTLKHQLKLCLTNLSSLPLIKALPSLCISNQLSQQIIQLATLVILDQTVLETINKGTSLEELLVNIQSLIQMIAYINQGQIPTEATPLSSDIDSSTDTREGALSPLHKDDVTTNATTRSYLYQDIIVILMTFRDKIMELVKDKELLDSFKWNSFIHYNYDTKEGSLTLSTLGMSLSYGFYYSGGYSMSLMAPPTERMAVYLLKIMEQHFAGLITDQAQSGIVSDIAVGCGYPLFPLLCTSMTSHDVIINHFKGITATGSWLYFDNFHLLPLPLIEAIVELVTVIKEAKTNKEHIVKMGEEKIRMTKIDTSYIIASITDPLQTSSLYSVFKSYSMIEAPHTTLIYEAMLLATGFMSASALSSFLSRYIKECPSISRTELQSVIKLSSQHIRNYYNTTTIADNKSSLKSVYSSVVQTVLISQLQGHSDHSSHVSSRQGQRLPALQEEEEEIEQQESNTPIHKKLEPLSLLISLWELQLHIPIELFQNVFPHIQVNVVIEELTKGQSDIVHDYPWSREVVESLQESRATSVMMSERDKETGSQYIEDTILESCLIKGLIPSAELQRAIHSLVQLILMHKVIRINGQWQNGRKEVIKSSIEVLKSLGYAITVTRLPVNAIHNEGILGDKDGIAVFPQLLSRLLSPSSNSNSNDNSLQLVLLECGSGGNTAHSAVEDCLYWIINEDQTLMHFPNSVSNLLAPSTKFLVIYSSSVPHQYSVDLPALSLDQCCITWENKIQTSFLTLEKDVQSSLTLLCQTSLSELFSILSPSHFIHSFDKQQLINSLCNLLKCLLKDDTSMNDIQSPFIYALIWIFGSTLTKEGRIILEKWLREKFPEILNPLHESLWHYKLITNSFELCTIESEDCSYIYTIKRKALTQFIQLLYTNGIHFIMDGTCGSGKTSFLVNTINSTINSSSESSPLYSMAHTYLNKLSSSFSYWQQLEEHLKWHSGVTYVPRFSDNLFVLLDDLHLSQDSLCTHGSITSLVNHHISTGTVLAPSSSYKEHSVGGVTYILTTDSTQLPLNNEMLSNMVYIHWDGYSTDELVYIYSTLLQRHFTSISSDLIMLLVGASVQIHNKLQSLFIDTIDRGHYSFVGTVLNTTLQHLTHRLKGDSTSVHDLLQCWLYESYWNYAAQLTSVVDRERYQETVLNALKKYFSDSQLLSPDLLNFTLSSKSDKDSLHEQLVFIQKELDTTVSPTPPLPLYDFTLTFGLYLSRLLHKPHPFSSILLVGMGHIEPLLLLLASYNGFTLQRPSQQISPTTTDGNKGVELFKESLKKIYTKAGVKNEQVIVLLDDQELCHPPFSYLIYVYQFIKDCSVTVEFTSEEKACVTNSLRSDVTQSGSEYTEIKAWNFFINRLKTNVRFIISLPDLSYLHQCGSILEMKNFLSVLKVCYELNWDRKKLLEVANYHLKRCNLPESLQPRTAHLLASLHMILREKTNSLTYCSNDKFEYFCERFCHQIEDWSNKLRIECQNLDNALDTYTKAHEKSLTLRDKLAREEVVLKEKGKSYIQLLTQIGQDTAIAKEQNKLVQKQTERINHLQKVLPEYEHVHSLYIEDLHRIEHETKTIALNLDQQSLLDIRSLTKPPTEIQELLEAVIIIIKSPSADLSWTKGAKRLMANLDRFKEMLMEFSQHPDVSGTLLESLQSYTIRPFFNGETMGKVYLAAGQLCSWVKGVERYHRMLQDNISRLEHRKSHVRTSLQEYTEKLSQLQLKVKALDERLEVLSVSLEQASIEKTHQDQVVTKMTKELTETTQFIQYLSAHYKEWIITRDNLSLAVSNKIGQLALSTCYMSYLTSLEPQQAMNIITTHLNPNIQEKGFPLEPPIPLQGLIGPLDAPLHAKTILDQNKVDPNQQPISKDEDPNQPISKDEDPNRPISKDKDPNQPISKDEDPNQPISKDKDPNFANTNQIQPISDPNHHIEYSSVADSKHTDHQYHYQKLCTNIHLILNPTKLQTVSPLTPLCQLYNQMIEESWNKWILVYDPEDIATSLLSDNNNWTIIDGHECSPQLLQSIEQAMIEGQKVILKKMSLPFHSSLIPIIEAGLQWQKTGQRALSLDFCGHRIYIKKSFQLIITTNCSSVLTTLKTLSCRFHLINTCPSLPLTIELLLLLQQQDKSSQEEMSSSLTEYTTIVRNIESIDKRRRELSEHLLKYLGKMTNGNIDNYTVGQLGQLMKDFNELQVNYRSNYQSLNMTLQSLTTLKSICLFSALIFILLHSLSKHHINFVMTWNEYSNIFHRALIESKIDTAQFKQLFISSIIKELSRCLDYTQLHHTAYCLHVLCTVDLSPTNIPTQIHQLLYIADLTGPDTKDELSFELYPSIPECINEDMLMKIHSLPVSRSFLDAVHQSMITQSIAWEGLLSSQVVITNNMTLPWKQTEPLTLEDFVLLKVIAPNSVSLYIETSVTELLKSLPVRVLKDVLLHQSRPGLPLCILHDENNLVSQINMMAFHDTFESLANVNSTEGRNQSLLSLSLGLDNETTLLSKLNKSSADYVLIQNIHLSSNSFIRALPFNLQSKTQKVILTANYHTKLPVQFLSQCYTVCLSQIAPTSRLPTLHYELNSQTNDTLKYLYTLLTCVSCLPQSLLTQLNNLTSTKRVLVFLLCAFHTHLTFSSSTSSPPQFTNLLYILTQLVSTYNDSTAPLTSLLHDITGLITNLYTTPPKDIISLYFTDTTTADIVISQDFTLTLPTGSVSPSSYTDHIIGVIDAYSKDSSMTINIRQELILTLKSILSLIIVL